jgi:flagellar hook-associated protein 1 FlgK
MGSGIYSVGVSALQNAQFGMSTAGHNISNANTEGYNRQRILQTTNIATLTGSGYIGHGAYISTVERIYDKFLAKQVTSAQTQVSSIEAYASALGELNMLLADNDAGLESAMEGFFAGINQVSADPSSLVARQTMVSAAQAMVSRFHILDEQVREQYENVDNMIKSYVTSINTFGQQIAQINQQIIKAEAMSGNNQPPNDLYDQRDQLIAGLNKLVGVQTTTNANGSMNVFFGNGQLLVVGQTAQSLVAMPASGNVSRLVVGLVSSAGTQELPESLISGGALSGVLQFRSGSLDAASNSLGQIAASMALVFNAQHALGQDLLGKIDGEPGFAADFFKRGEPTVISNTNNPPGAMATASYEEPLYKDGNFYTNLTASDYRLDYDGTNLTLTRLSDNKSWSGATDALLNAAVASSPEGSQGFSIGTGGLAPGASFLIQPTRNAAQSLEVNPIIAADVRQIAVATPVLAQAAPTNTGTVVVSPGSVVSGYVAPAAGAPITLTYSGGNLTGFPSFPVTVTDSNGANILSSPYGADPVPYENGATYTFSGISFTLTGTPRDGDEFTIARNSNGVSDNRNAMLLGQMQTVKTMAGQTANFSTVYTQLVGNAGNKGSELNTVLTAQQTVLAEAEKARDAVSGVNLDEEAVSLLQYQQSYQAAAKMLQLVSGLFDSILAIG